MAETGELLTLNAAESVHRRYSAASKVAEGALCCPVEYDRRLLDVIPQEIIERDYGCGDPSRYVREGDTVLDLGSGGGKLCYMISQLVGSRGQVIGVDLNNDMLGLARSHQKDVAARIGYDNVQFLRGRIQDLALDLDRLRQEMQTIDWRHADSTSVLMDLQNRLRSRTPMIADASVDCVVSNCVLNLVDPHDRKQLFAEIFRVLKPGGRAAISDIVSDEDVPVEMQNDSQLWSGCISGAWREDLFVEEFIRCGFQGVRIDKRQAEPWRTVQGIEFRSCTVLAFKPFSDVCLERNQAVIYRGPFSSVCDDDGHTFVRGERTAVCEKTYQLLSEQSFNGCFCFIEPYEVVPRESAGMFDCTRDRKRHPRESKGTDQTVKQQPEQECCGGSCC